MLFISISILKNKSIGICKYWWKFQGADTDTLKNTDTVGASLIANNTQIENHAINHEFLSQNQDMLH